jgi:hypothetical protein
MELYLHFSFMLHDVVLSHMVGAEGFAEPHKTERKIKVTDALL